MEGIGGVNKDSLSMLRTASELMIELCVTEKRPLRTLNIYKFLHNIVRLELCTPSTRDSLSNNID